MSVSEKGWLKLLLGTACVVVVVVDAWHFNAMSEGFRLGFAVFGGLLIDPTHIGDVAKAVLPGAIRK